MRGLLHADGVDASHSRATELGGAESLRPAGCGEGEVWGMSDKLSGGRPTTIADRRDTKPGQPPLLALTRFAHDGRD